MYQPWIFGTMVAAGGGLVALTVTLQRPPTVPRATAEPLAAVHVVPPAPPLAVAEPAAPEPVLELAPIVIEARHARAPAPQGAVPASVKPAERPCSEWRELGPTHVVSGTPSGDVGVRELCQ